MFEFKHVVEDWFSAACAALYLDLFLIFYWEALL